MIRSISSARAVKKMTGISEPDLRNDFNNSNPVVSGKPTSNIANAISLDLSFSKACSAVATQIGSKFSLDKT